MSEQQENIKRRSTPNTTSRKDGFRGISLTVDYPTLYRHVVLPEKAEAFDALCTTPLIVDLMDKVKGIILKDSSETWPPQSAKHSVNLVIDVQALNAIVSGSAPSTDA